MEKEKFFTTEGNPVPPNSWNSSSFGMEIQTNELNCTTSEQLSNCFINPNWDNSMDQSDPFESALSSIVSSPATSNAGGESIVLRELIGRLGSICNSGDISPQSYFNGNNSTNTSCYSTPLNSPPKLNLSMMRGKHFPSHPPISTDPGFAERAARFSCFGGKLSRVSSNQSMKVAGSPMGVQENKEEGISGSDKKFSKDFPPENPDSVEGSSVSEQSDHANARKRKSVPRGKGKEIPSSPATKDVKAAGENEESNAKRSKSDGNEKESKENSKAPEPPKDYIHVRARRGQATDSHSLAERVRREKISERMKFLQDLVPGCNKVTGKAVMLDEIINYVQSLQRQVEFLSMKLSTVNPRMDLSMEALLSKDIFQSHGSVHHNNTYPVDTSAQGFLYGYQSQQASNLHGDISHGTETPFSMNPSLNSALRRNPSMQMPPIDAFGEVVASQDLTFWEDDLQSVVQMGFAQNQAQSFHGTKATSQMKLEL